MKEKILEVSCNGLVIGGVQRVMMNIVSELHDQFTFDALVFTQGPDYFDDEFRSYGGEIYRIPNKTHSFKRNIDSYIRGPRIFFGTWKLLREHGPYAAIHCHNYFESAYCLLAARAAGVKIRIAHSHNDISNISASRPMRLKRRLLRPLVNKNATARVACSRNAAKYLFGQGVPAQTIMNGIDPQPFEAGLHCPGYQAGAPIKLLHVGNFTAQKNQLFLVEILKRLKERNAAFSMTMVGGGDEAYRSAVAARIQTEGLADFVTILPPDTDVPAQMRNADLFLLPSLFEGLGIVVIEAQASGLHCVVSQAVPPEADLGNLQYAPSLDADLWADAIGEIIRRGQERKPVNLEQFRMKNVAEEYRRLYQSNRGNSNEE